MNSCKFKAKKISKDNNNGMKCHAIKCEMPGSIYAFNGLFCCKCHKKIVEIRSIYKAAASIGFIELEIYMSDEEDAFRKFKDDAHIHMRDKKRYLLQHKFI